MGGSYTIERRIVEWNRAVAASSTAIDTDEDGIVIHYETLTADTASEVRRLCKFLGVDYEPQMLTAYAGVTTPDRESGRGLKEPAERSDQ